jgi:ribosomal protein S18 acetylase RimI-like enzyme
LTTIEVANELNEVGWWSNWGRLSWFTPSCYGLISSDFREPLFNHSGFIDSSVSLKELLPTIRKWYEQENYRPSFFLQESPKYEPIRRVLSSKGYSLLDKHFVMLLKHPRFRRREAVTCTFIGERRADDWSKAYLSAFYGEHSLLNTVSRSVKTALRGGKSKLLLSEFLGRIAGSLAIYTDGDYSGVYCVGTVPELRGKGVATEMLSQAFRYSQEQKTRLGLQTFASDSAESFYLKLGFERAYSKDVLVL